MSPYWGMPIEDRSKMVAIVNGSIVRVSVSVIFIDSDWLKIRNQLTIDNHDRSIFGITIAFPQIDRS